VKYLARVLSLLVLAAFLAACGGATTTSSTPTSGTPSPTRSVTLNIFAAASLTESFKEMAKEYEAKNAGVKLKYNFNGSQILVQQLLNGATADVFASADQPNMKKAVDGGLVTESKIFARNKLVVITPSSNPGNITTLKDLSKKGTKIVVAAPAVPVGKYSLQALDKMGKSAEYGPDYVNAVRANFVSQEENVKAVVQKVQLGEADAGIVYQTDVTAAVTDKVKLIEIPDIYNVIAQYPIAVLKNAPSATEAEKFVQYVLSTDGQAVLTKYHFTGAPGS
jgi:molybdate transport system substrate-binding protein